jgi:hypothetical protein
MNTYEKVAALVIRLTSLGLILYSCILATMMIFFARQMILMLLPTLIAGIVLFWTAIPLSRMFCRGIE